MIKKLLALVVLTALTGFCIYGACLSAGAKDQQGLWLFIAFAFFPAIPLFLLLLHILSARFSFLEPLNRALAGPPPKSMPVRFVPHWFVMSAILAVVIAVVLILLASIFR
ncbi:MAG TPA: hypothetical protein PLO78_04575 [Candidatus Omnitrophota bacterium]|nr:hypothetical protein [Candidatus Omnitrophota bacterium]